MKKIVLFACFIGMVMAKPSVLHHHHPELLRTVSVHSEVPIVRTKLIHEPSLRTVQEHTIEKVGEHVEHIPTAVSHQSQTIVHSSANKITPILAPALKTHYIPTVNTYTKQFVENVPVVRKYVEAAPAPVVVHEAPYIHHHVPAPAIEIPSKEAVVVEAAPAPEIHSGYGLPTSQWSAPISQW